MPKAQFTARVDKVLGPYPYDSIINMSSSGLKNTAQKDYEHELKHLNESIKAGLANAKTKRKRNYSRSKTAKGQRKEEAEFKQMVIYVQTDVDQ